MADKGPGVEQVGVSVKIDADAALSGSRKLSAAFGRLRDASGRFVKMRKPTQETLESVATSSKRAAKGLGGVSSSAFGVGSALAALGVGAVARETIAAAASYEQLRTSLITFEGSADAAAARFERLRKLAEETPFTAEEVVKAWGRMEGAGLQASEQFLRDAGDIVAGAGDSSKTIIDFVNAVSAATRGEGMRLRENFGITMKKLGGDVEFTFDNVTKRVKNTKSEIQRALQEIAREKFGGAMERQSQTLAGVWSTLKDSAAGLADEVAQGGLLQALKDVVVYLSQTSASGKSTARELGETLGGAVRSAASAVKFLIDNARAVGAVVTFGAAVVTATSAINGMRLAFIALSASNPLGWIALAVGALVTLIAYIDDVKDAIRDLMVEFSFMYEAMAALDHPAGKMGLAVIEQTKKKNAQEAFSNITSPFTALIPSKEEIKSSVLLLQSNLRAAGKGQGKGAGGDSSAEKAAKSLAKDLAAIEQAAYSASESLGLAIGGATDAEIEAAEAMARFRAEHASASQAQLQRAQTALAQEQAAKAQLDTLRELEALTRAATSAEEFFGYAIGGATEAEIEAEAALREFVLAHPAATDAEKALAAAMLGRKAAADGASRGLAAHKQALKELGKASAEEAKRQSLIKQGLSGAELEAQMEAYRAIVDLKAEGAKLSAQEAASLTAQHVALAESKAQTEALVARQAALQGALQPLTEMLTREFGFLEDSVGILVSGAQDFANTLVDGILQGKVEWGEFGKKMLADLAKAALRAAFIFAIKTGAKAALGVATGGASLAAGGALSGIGSVLAGVLHQGGPAGSGPRRAVPSGLFAGAPRYHQGGYAGLKPGEVPAILQTGERVLSRKEQRNQRPQTRVLNAPRTFNVSISTPDLDSFRRDSGGAVRRFSRDLEREERRR